MSFYPLPPLSNALYVFDFYSMHSGFKDFFNYSASTAHAIGAKLLLKYPSTTFVKAKS